jgi:hypothetical protein
MGIPLLRERESERVITVRSSDRRDVWVGQKPTDRLRASRGRRRRAKNATQQDTLRSERRSLLKKDLTEPTLLEMSDYRFIRYWVVRRGKIPLPTTVAENPSFLIALCVEVLRRFAMNFRAVTLGRKQ